MEEGELRFAVAGQPYFASHVTEQEWPPTATPLRHSSRSPLPTDTRQQPPGTHPPSPQTFFEPLSTHKADDPHTPSPLQPRPQLGHGLGHWEIKLLPANNTEYSLLSAPTPPSHPWYQDDQLPRPQVASGQPTITVHRPTHCCVNRTPPHPFWTSLSEPLHHTHHRPTPAPSARGARQRRPPRPKGGPYARLRSPPSSYPRCLGRNLPCLTLFPAPTRCRHFK